MGVKSGLFFFKRDEERGVYVSASVILPEVSVLDKQPSWLQFRLHHWPMGHFFSFALRDTPFCAASAPFWQNGKSLSHLW